VHLSDFDAFVPLSLYRRSGSLRETAVWVLLGSPKGWTFLQGSGTLENWSCSAIFKKYLQCVLAAKILTVDFVVCTLAVKKNQGRFRHIGLDHSLVR
jgi:hypothetical protein